MSPVDAGRARRAAARPRSGAAQRAVVVLACAVMVLLAGAAPAGTPRPQVATVARHGVPAAAGPASAWPALAPTPPVARRVVQLESLLRTRASAVRQRDRSAFLSTVDPAAAAFRRQQATMFDRLAAVPLAAWDYRYQGAATSVPRDRSPGGGERLWRARVLLTYRLADVDTADVRREQTLTLVSRAGRWLISGDTPGTSSRDLWELGDVSVARGERSVVIGMGRDLPRVAREVDAAARRVDAVWGTAWPRRVVVEVPGSQQQMALLLGSPQGELSQVAAVTSGELVAGSAQDSTSDRVIVNPPGFRPLGRVGRRVVLAHELSHVATRATTSAEVPVWLSEGFADYVGYLDSGIPRQVIVADLVVKVRAGASVRLPTDRDFDPARTAIAPAYSAAWSACDLIVRTYGRQRLVDVYRATAGSGVRRSSAVAGSADARLSAAFERVLGTAPAAFEVTWRHEVQRMVAAS